MPARPVSRALFLGALGAAAFVGCSLDWQVRLSPVDDGGTDTADVQVEGAASPDAPAGDVEKDAGTDADFCKALRANVEDKKKKARICMLAPAGHCTEKQMDICCPVFVAKGDSGATDALRRAVDEFNDAGCEPDCKGCTGAVVSGCVQMGAELLCSE